MNIDKKLLQAKCQHLLRDYEPLLKEIIEQEVLKMNSGTGLKSTVDEIAIEAIHNVGVKEGMRRVLAKINELSRD